MFLIMNNFDRAICDSHYTKFIPKAKYMTLGPKFFCCSEMTITRRRKHLFQ